MRLDHVALWTRDRDTLERLRAFYAEHFGARAGARYESARRPGFASYFLTFPDGGARLELMTAPGVADRGRGEALGYAHLALALGSRAAVDAAAARLAAAGAPVASPPRLTGDGYYEAVVVDPDGNTIEITA
jgi:lactoylglutathione lyase